MKLNSIPDFHLWPWLPNACCCRGCFSSQWAVISASADRPREHPRTWADNSKQREVTRGPLKSRLVEVVANGIFGKIVWETHSFRLDESASADVSGQGPGPADLSDNRSVLAPRIEFLLSRKYVTLLLYLNRPSFFYSFLFAQKVRNQGCDQRLFPYHMV